MKVGAIKDIELIKDIKRYFKERNERDYVMFMTGIYTGLRISDILRLRVGDVKDKDRMRIIQQKTGNAVAITLNSELKEVYKSYCENKDKMDYLISNERVKVSKAITRDRAYRIMNIMAKEFQLDRIGTHTLRKTCGYHLYINSDKDIGLVMQVLGQKDEASTLRYIGINDIDIEKAFNLLKFN
ncbi:MAG: tyrosine-type recombinase/integrase [Cetobacterium sp.]|uniref:tyrosine-type recombinase/integrase n=1 Tax=Cetobacterium sp. TaxID=2071632 RepID=UPI003F406A29